MTTAPCFLVRLHSPSRKPGSGMTMPKLPTIGSTITAAVSVPQRSRAADNAGRALNGTVITSWAMVGGTPALSGVPRVEGPEPAATSTRSEWPW
ncbi:hypothetical protein D3C86_1946620 [compost metagenome]